MKEYTIIHKFIETAKNSKEKVCIVANKKEYTYLEIDEMSSGLAQVISSIFSEKQLPILVFGDHPLQIACSIIGIMKSENIVVPISNKTPLYRIQEIIKSCNIKGYISQNEHPELDLPHIPVKYEKCSNFIYKGVATDDAYVIYTSGTTGKSKGVLVGHRGFVNSVQERNKILGIGSNNNSINLMSFSFDGFFMSFFSPLIVGASLFLPSSVTDYKEVCSIIKDYPVSTFLCTPTFLKSMLIYAEDGLLDNISLISLAGEPIALSLIRKFCEKYPFIQIANEYGPTENSICTSINPDIRYKSVISVGKLISHVKAKIVSNSKLCGQGDPGELYLSGIGLAKGYINDVVLTNEKFLKCNDTTWYRTGDLAYWKNDEIVILGRVDRQVKVNGYRIDLGEIENAVMKMKDIDDCAVIYNKTDGVTVYWTASHQVEPTTIIAFLKHYLNEYMFPANYIQVSSIPMTENGKIDYNALYELGKSDINRGDICEELYDTSHSICLIFRDILQLNECNEDINFFAYGGNSILAVVLCARIKDELGVEFDIEDVRINPTPRLISNIIMNKSNEKSCIGIVPFNKFWFIDCFFTSILAVLEYYSIPIAPFIRSFAILDIENEGTYGFVYDYKKKLPEVFGDLDMKYDTGILENDFEEKILNHVMKYRVVMLHVDCFYIPYCKEKYQKEHFEHVVTIVGYDKKNKEFDIIDQENLNSVSFVYHKASLDSIRDAAYAEIVNRETFDNVDFVSVYPLKKTTLQEFKTLDDSQFNFVVEKTIEYLKRKPNDIIKVLQLILNYLKVEKTVFVYLNNEKMIEFFKTKEIQIMKFFMKIVADKTNNYEKTESLIYILEGWNRL